MIAIEEGTDARSSKSCSTLVDRSVQEPSVDQERRTKPRPVLLPVPTDFWRALPDLRTSGTGHQSAARAPPLILSCHRRVRRRPVRHGHRSALRRVAVHRQTLYRTVPCRARRSPDTA
ncbi:hypothetical protein BN2537_17309 [Streptomyces venezuelae]|nr:hypothetical protein BN2537_17309 [Streptomyces venezuelae]